MLGPDTVFEQDEWTRKARRRIMSVFAESAFGASAEELADRAERGHEAGADRC